MKLNDESLVPLVKAADLDLLKGISFTPKMIELEMQDISASDLPSILSGMRSAFPDTTLALRLHFTSGEALLHYQKHGISIFHLLADYHGCGKDGRFALDLIREAHLAFVEAGIRDTVTLIGSGGIVAAEHVPKAIIAGLDLVALDTPLLVALQARFIGECRDRIESRFALPNKLNREWGVQRLKNMTAAWRDQLLEILGAMGLREVRRLRGEIGRAMFQDALEREAFAEIEGYK